MYIYIYIYMYTYMHIHIYIYIIYYYASIHIYIYIYIVYPYKLLTSRRGSTIVVSFAKQSQRTFVNPCLRDYIHIYIYIYIYVLYYVWLLQYYSFFRSAAEGRARARFICGLESTCGARNQRAWATGAWGIVVQLIVVIYDERNKSGLAWPGLAWPGLA